MKNLFLFVFLLFLWGCATTRNYEAILNTWIGDSENYLVSKWGIPTNSYIMSNGNKVIEYNKTVSSQVGGYSYTMPQTTYLTGNINTYGDINASGNYYGTSTEYVTKTAPTYNITYWCNTRFILNKDGVIQSWSWEGNNCVAYR